MCVHFFSFDHLRIKLQSSDFFRGTKFRALLFLSLHSSSSSFELLSMASYGGELLLDSSFTWSGVSIHLSPSPFCCNQTSRSKGIHWWRRSKAFKLPWSYIKYFSNIKSFVQLKDLKLVGLKSHDCHVLMQQLLAMGLWQCKTFCLTKSGLP